MRERYRITVQGIVQGVGFRPFVYGLAHRYELVGRVRNDASGVAIEVEGDSRAIDRFLEALHEEAPPLAAIEQVAAEKVARNGDTEFVIAPSGGDAEKQVFVSPDVSVCDDCLRELFDPTDRRYRYPFINCTNCGPRFTIVRNVPYDRHLTTMAAFPMCADCRREYDDPLDRRFHAQPNACPACGPQIAFYVGRWTTDDGRTPTYEHTAENGDAIDLAADALRVGAIVAVKGLGGYHLACDATNEEAVTRLRARKHREYKPFAVMARDLTDVETFCHVAAGDAALLTSRQRPIVLLRQRVPCGIAEAVAPGHRYLGFMLPYTPLHELLLEAAPTVLVMTSGNLSDEPIVYRDDEAFERLAGIADAILTHNREIHVRCDDSVVRSFRPSNLPTLRSVTLFLRRSRGYAPRPIALPFECPQPILAVGAHLKNTFCLGKGRHAFVSHHVGDLENLETLTAFRESIEHFERLFDVRPSIIAHDLHPEYLATKYALEREGSRGNGRSGHAGGVEHVAVQHHHAHVASVIAEHGLDGEVLGVAFDGTGYGTNGRVWGGEFLVADYAGFTRAAHLAEVPLPGGSAAIREPWRVAAAHLYGLYGEGLFELEIPFVRDLDRETWQVLRQMIDRDVNSPLSSSMGRLFDAVAALIGVRRETTYEGQAAIELEMLTDDARILEAYTFDVCGGDTPYVIDTQPIIAAVVDDLRRAVPPAVVATRFHNAVVELVHDVCTLLRDETGLNRVALSGGVFQNAYLLRRTLPRLRDAGFDVYVNTKVPPNDGGISLGQVAVAAAQVGRDDVVEEGEQVLCV